MTAYRLRLASEPDAEAICRIYNQGIVDRVATLETELRTPGERRQWLASRGPRHPVIVAEVEPEALPGSASEGLSGHAEPVRASLGPPSVQAGLTAPATIAWASLNVFNAREAYRYISVYVERGWRGRGVGRAMLQKLVELGRMHGYHKLVLSAFPGNAAGMALYSKSGFCTVGIYREQGQLDGKWVDTIVTEKLL